MKRTMKNKMLRIRKGCAPSFILALWFPLLITYQDYPITSQMLSNDDGNEATFHEPGTFLTLFHLIQLILKADLSDIQL